MSALEVFQNLAEGIFNPGCSELIKSKLPKNAMIAFKNNDSASLREELSKNKLFSDMVLVSNVGACGRFADTVKITDY